MLSHSSACLGYFLSPKRFDESLRIEIELGSFCRLAKATGAAASLGRVIGIRPNLVAPHAFRCSQSAFHSIHVLWLRLLPLPKQQQNKGKPTSTCVCDEDHPPELVSPWDIYALSPSEVREIRPPAANMALSHHSVLAAASHHDLVCPPAANMAMSHQSVLSHND
eukprot:g74694.t1